MDMEFFVGQILILPYNFAPRWFVKCDGTRMDIKTNEVLYSLLGTKFGGDGREEFCLPKIEDPHEGVSYYICIRGVYPPRS